MKRIVVLLLFACCVLQELVAQRYGKFAEELINYQSKAELKKQRGKLGLKACWIDSSTFNMQEYLSIFSALKPKEGYVVECVYFFTNYEGMPMFYGREAQYSRDSFVMMLREKHKERVGIVRIGYADEDWRYLSGYAFDEKRKNKGASYYFVPSDTKMGYFQLLMFYLYGDAFALWWHALELARFLIYEREQIESLIQRNRNEDFMVCFEEDKIRPLLKCSLEPQVKMKKTHCEIIIYEFHHSHPRYGGVHKNTYSISRAEPYQITLQHSEKLVANEIRGLF